VGRVFRPGSPFDDECDLGGAWRDRGFDGRAKRHRIDGGVSIEFRFDRFEVGEQGRPIHKATIEHLLDVTNILFVAAFNLGERLCVEIEVMKRDAAFPRDERAAILPAWFDRNEVIRRREFDVDLQLFFQSRDSAQDRILIGDQANVDVDGARASETAAWPTARMNRRIRSGSASERMRRHARN